MNLQINKISLFVKGWVHTINDRNLLQTMMTSNKSRITFDQQNRTNDVISNMKFLNYSIAKRGKTNTDSIVFEKIHQ